MSGNGDNTQPGFGWRPAGIAAATERGAGAVQVAVGQPVLFSIRSGFATSGVPSLGGGGGRICECACGISGMAMPSTDFYPTHVFSAPGIYYVSMLGWDAAGNGVLNQATVSVVPEPPMCLAPDDRGGINGRGDSGWDRSEGGMNRVHAGPWHFVDRDLRRLLELCGGFVEPATLFERFGETDVGLNEFWFAAKDVGEFFIRLGVILQASEGNGPAEGDLGDFGLGAGVGLRVMLRGLGEFLAADEDIAEIHLGQHRVIGVEFYGFSIVRFSCGGVAGAVEDVANLIVGDVVVVSDEQGVGEKRLGVLPLADLHESGDR